MCWCSRLIDAVKSLLSSIVADDKEEYVNCWILHSSGIRETRPIVRFYITLSTTEEFKMNVEEMISAIQKKLGVQADGRAGPETWGAIYAQIVSRR